MQTGRIQRQQESKNELKERTYSVLLKELSKNLQLQKENPSKTISTVFYYNDDSSQNGVKGIYLGNFKKSLLKENKYSLQYISEEIPFLKIVCTCNPDDVIDYERLKVHPFYYEFIHVQENYESCNCDESKIISYIINCRQDVEHAAEIMTLICVDVLGINPFFLCEKGQEIDCLISPFITVVVDISDNADLTWNEYKNRIDKMVDYGPIIDNFLRNAKLEFNIELMEFLKSVDAQWYVLCELKLGKIYEKHGATLIPNELVKSVFKDEISTVYDDGVSFCRDDDRYLSKKVIALIPTLRIYEEVFHEVNCFDLNVKSKQDAIHFIEEFNSWVLADSDNQDFFSEWYDAIELAEHYLSIDPTLNEKCLIQLCHHYQRIGNYTHHRVKNIPIEYLRTEMDEYGVCYSSRRVLSVNRNLFQTRDYVVRDGIEQIDDDVFAFCKKMEHLTLPVSLRRIGMNVFCHCDNLEELLLPENVNYVGECLCEHCKSLKRVVLLDKIKHIKIASFYCCDSLEEVKLPVCLSTLSDNVFAFTPMLKQLDLPKTIFWIGGECFWNVAIEKLKISKYAEIADDAFLESKTEIEYI